MRDESHPFREIEIVQAQREGGDVFLDPGAENKAWRFDPDVHDAAASFTPENIRGRVLADVGI
jgi:hypothetical protein